jgi:enediyne biosynthesis protein E4
MGAVLRSTMVACVFATIGALACQDADGDPPCVQHTVGEPVHFTDVTQEAGIHYQQWQFEPMSACLEDWDSSLCVAARLTGGATVGDYDGDGWDDLYVTRLDGPDILYRNRGDGTFEDVTLQAGLGANLPTNGAAFGDVDDDGHLDLLVTTVRGDRWFLYLNRGDGTFIEQAEGRGVASWDGGVRGGMSGCFGDYDRDGWVDLHVNEWLPLVDEEFPDNFTRLFRNRGGEQPGHFDDVTVAAGVDMRPLVSGGVMSFASIFTDLDDDGWPDLVVVADFFQTRLFWNDGDGTFHDGTLDLGVDVPSDENGMGLAVGDMDGDGRLDWFVTSIYDDRFPCDDCAGWGHSGNRLYRNLGGRRFEDATDHLGVRDGGWGWGTAAFDHDNDGALDLVMTNGYIFPEIASADVFIDEPMRLWRNAGAGQPMTEVAAQVGLADRGAGKALLVFDYDGDGDLDVFVVNNAGEPRLYRNDGPTGCFLRVRAEGRGARAGGTNRQGLGARVEVRIREGDAPVIREINGGCGYLGQHENVAHFGLATEPRVHEVRVRWPTSGTETVLHDVPVNQTLIVREPG